MGHKELLAALNTLKVQTGSLACLGCGYEHGCSVHGCAILREAVEQLKGRHPDDGEPLALEQLRELNGQPVWVEFEDGSGGLWGIVHVSVFEQIVFPNGLHCTIGHPYYGKIYKAYAYPPAHIDREAWTAEWVDNDKSEEMMCKCSKCGYPVSYFWGKTAFCPGCGRAMKPEAWDELEKRLRG